MSLCKHRQMTDLGPDYWNAQATTFDQGPDHGLLDPDIRMAWRSLLLEHLPSAPVDLVDLGCGTGTLSVLLAREGYRVRGVDSAIEMVRAARRKAIAAGLGATFALGDAGDLPYTPSSCDVVLVRHVLWACPILRQPWGVGPGCCARVVGCCSSRGRGTPGAGSRRVSVSECFADTSRPSRSHHWTTSPCGASRCRTSATSR